MDPQSLNRYAYALNDPVELVDPSGLDPCHSEVAKNRRKLRLSEFSGGGPSNLAFDSDPFAQLTDDGGCTLNPPGGGGGATIDPPILNNGQLPDPCATDTAPGGCVSVSDNGGPDNPYYDDPSTSPGIGIPIHTITPGGGSGGGPSGAGLEEILKKYKECAAILGGLSKALALNKMANVQSIDAPGFVPPKDEEAAGVVNALKPDAFGTVLAPAGVVFNGTPQWDGKPFTIYTNSTYAGYSPSQQLTMKMHELHHVSLGKTPAGQGIDDSTFGAAPDIQKIAGACKTAIPPTYGPQK